MSTAITAEAVLALLDRLTPRDVRALADAGFALDDLRDVTTEDDDGPPLVRAALATYGTLPGVVRAKADAEQVRLLHVTLHGPAQAHAPLPVPKDTPGKFLLWWSGLIALWAALVTASVATQFSSHTGLTILIGFAGIVGFGAYATAMQLKGGFVPLWLTAVPVLAAAAFLVVTFTASKSYLGVKGVAARVPLVSAHQSSPGANGNRWICQVQLPDGKVRELSSCSDAMVKQDLTDASRPTAAVAGLSVDVVYDPGDLVAPHPGSVGDLGPAYAFYAGGVGAVALVAGLLLTTSSAAAYQRSKRKQAQA